MPRQLPLQLLPLTWVLPPACLTAPHQAAAWRAEHSPVLSLLDGPAVAPKALASCHPCAIPCPSLTPANLAAGSASATSSDSLSEEEEQADELWRDAWAGGDALTLRFGPPELERSFLRWHAISMMKVRGGRKVWGDGCGGVAVPTPKLSHVQLLRWHAFSATQMWCGC